jgi:calcium-dependent protein kinase
MKQKERLHEMDGTSYYIAPEVLEGDYDEKCDIWSCGVILYVLLCGYPPFYGDTDEDIYKQVLKGEYDFPKEEWDNVSEEAKNLVKKMIEKDTKKRITALEALQDEWFKINKQKKSGNKLLAKNVLNNMKKFKKNKKFEQATISFIINQLVLKEERKDLEKQFKEWDKNGDGVLSRDEIIEGYKKTYGSVDEGEIDNMINSIDLDGNGVIDYNEFLTCAMNKDKILKNENLEICFKAFDSDNSGKISLDEISAIFSNGDKEKMNKEEIEALKKMIGDADANGDGEISFKEFKDLMRKFFL